MLYTGIIYKYTSPSNKVYIGQTRDEFNRRQKFLSKTNYTYAGTKINKARAKYGPENFEYSVLFKIESNNEEEIIGVLNKKEIEFIELFDSFYNGYNSTKGGENSYIRTEENRQKLSNITKEYYKTHKSAVAKAILQFDFSSGCFLKEWESAKQAAEALKLYANSITNVCKQKQNQTGGYIWRYRSDFEEIPNKIQLKSRFASNLPVIQYDLNGKELKRWKNMSIAAAELGYSLGNFSTYCNGRNNHKYKGFLYYRGEKDSLENNPHNYSKATPKLPNDQQYTSGN